LRARLDAQGNSIGSHFTNLFSKFRERIEFHTEEFGNHDAIFEYVYALLNKEAQFAMCDLIESI